ncbi:MAG: tRNA pseudouridine(55) synthase TruB [Candidatus Omnitrophota bacterium]
MKETVHNDPYGILIVDKEKGMTSHDIVDRVRRRFRIKKLGHAGTLDPNATGVLVLLFGKATKLSNSFLEEEKEYEAVLKLGERTDSGDCDGVIVETYDVNVTEQDISKAVKHFIGQIEQIPPMVSAKKVKGKRLYKLARKGITVERSPRLITIREFEIKKIDMPFVNFRVVCSKGTYIRQIAEDIGIKLECGAHLTELRRVRSGGFSIGQAVSLSDLLNMNREVLDESIIRV